MIKLLLYYNFIIVSIMMLSGFIGAKSVPQLISAILFFPVFILFAQLVIPKRRKAIPVPMEVSPIVNQSKKIAKNDPIKLAPATSPNIFDRDRRMFIKLIGSAGLTVLFFSLFTKKAHGAFFGSVPGPGTVAIKDIAGVQIDPAQNHPTDGYKISQLDDSTPSYYGFIRKDGAWFIMKEESNGDYRYTKGASSFSTNWTDRASLTYGYFDAIF